MATTKQIDIFGQLKGLDFHLALEPTEGESGMEALVKAVDYLVSKGATARPLPGRAGGRSKEPIATICPTCQGAISKKDWAAKDGKKFVIHQCETSRGEHYKKYEVAA